MELPPATAVLVDTFANYLNIPGIKMLMVNRGMNISDVTQLVLSLLTGPHLVITETPTLYPDTTTIDITMQQQAIDQSNGKGFTIVSDTNSVDYISLRQWGGDIIVILQYGVTPDVVNGIRNNLKLTSTVQVMWPVTQHIEFVLDEAIMSPEQLAAYRFARSEENRAGKATAGGEFAIPQHPSMVYGGALSPSKRGSQSQVAHHAQTRLHALERGNFVYPPELQAEYDRARENRSKSLPPDKTIENKGWISLETINDLPTYSPKFEHILRRVFAYTPEGATQFTGKFVIVTGFLAHHGLELLASLLTLTGMPPYKLYGGLKPYERERVVNEFNGVTAGVLIMTSSLTVDFVLQGVDELIFVEGTDVKLIEPIINSIFRYTNYVTIHTLKVVFMISRISETQASVDAEKYKEFDDYEAARRNAFDRGIERALVLVLNQGAWMVANIGR